jgi:hypothetical protein
MGAVSVSVGAVSSKFPLELQKRVLVFHDSCCAR